MAMETATLGAGCFWCVEAVFQHLKGVESVMSGYAGGEVDDPTYYQVCSGRTGHAEVVQVVFDPDVISFESILDVFWRSHDPTTLNRQGPDSGTQYRSAIFYHSEAQRETAEKSKLETDASDLWKDSIVTEVTAFTNFYVAEEQHQDFYLNNPNQPYCSVMISPKLQKLQKDFKELLAN